MKLNYKKSLLILGLITSFTSYGFFGLPDSNTPILAGILAETTATKISTITQELKQLEQISIQIKQLENQYLTLQGLNEKFIGLNVQDLIDKIATVKRIDANIKDTLNSAKSKFDNISKFLEINSEQLEKDWSPAKKKEVEEKVNEMRNGVKEIIKKYNEKIDNGNYSFRKNDLNRTQNLLKGVNTSTGALSAIQAIGQMIGQTNELLADVKELLKNQQKLSVTLSESKETQEDVEKLERKALMKEEEERAKKLKEKYNTENIGLKLRFD